MVLLVLVSSVELEPQEFSFVSVIADSNLCSFIFFSGTCAVLLNVRADSSATCLDLEAAEIVSGPVDAVVWSVTAVLDDFIMFVRTASASFMGPFMFIVSSFGKLLIKTSFTGRFC
jgi:hypothetical protein